MKITLKQLSMGLAAAGMLTIYGCGGGGGDSATAGASATTTITPSLGKFSKGTKVKLSRVDANLTEISTQPINDSGSAVFSLNGYTGAVVVEVIGDANSKYYDEQTKSDRAFGLGEKLRAVAPTAQAEIGVSALTNAATIKLETEGSLKSVSTTQINNANAKVAAIFGLPNILIAPKPVSDTTGKTLDVATPSDKYALVLSALAKTGADALTTATALASDLKQDDLLDGQQDSAGTPSTLTGYAPSTLAAAYQDAAKDSATTTSESFVALEPLTVTTDVSKVTGTADDPINLAKAMFAELRTTLNSFANGKTGFLDTQATRMEADLTANVTPEMSKVIGRISVLRETLDTFEKAKTYSSSSNANGFVVGKNPITGADALIRNRINRFSPADLCWTDSTTGITSKMTCAHGGSDAYDGQKIKMVVFELTSTPTNQYSYTATRYNFPVTFGEQGQVTLNGAPSKAQVVGSDPVNPSYIPSGSGTVTMTGSSSNMTGLTLNGTLPPSATAADGKTFTTGVDTVAISAVSTPLATANHVRFSLSGSVSTTNATDATKVVTLSFDSGSFIDLDETNASTGGTQSVAAKLVGTAKTTASKFTGTVEFGSYMADADGRNFDPTKVLFTGSISDTSTGGAGEILTGKLEATAANYNLFHSNQPESSSNYIKTTMTFTGTVQAPARPLLKLVVAVNRTGLTTGKTTLNYSYGTTSITGSGTVDSANSTNNSMTLSNQNGITVNTKTGIVTNKSDVKVATITNSSISYEDGVTESLN